MSLAAFLLAVGPEQANAQLMALPDSLSVSETGSAIQSFPIAVPPGTAGVVPSLSITYNSQGGNGIVGLGFTLNGLASIGRCPQTRAIDGVHGGVNYDSDDRFCLDGQRLIAISGDYGADGTEYRTEIESFSKVISYGAAGTGPAWFKVWTKSGQVMEFGNSTDSRILATGKAEARSWSVNKVSDTPGNYYSIAYVNDAANGQAYPDRIDYTGNDGASLLANNSVRFVYDTGRTDAVTTYQAGSFSRTTVILTNVQTYTGETLVSDYRFTYAASPSTGRMRMMSITLCDGGSACLPATTIGWQNKGEGSFERTTLPVADGIPDDYLVHGAGDFNGDGLTDLYLNLSQGNGRAYPSDTSRPAQVWLSKGDGTFERKILPVADGMPDDYLVHGSGDFNGDGLTDFYINLSQDNGRAYPSDTSRPAQVWLSKGDGTFEKKILPVADGMPDDYRVYSSGDFNGDGLTDLYLHFSHSNGRAAGTPNYSRQSEIWLSKGDGTFDREILPVADSMPNEYQVHSSGDFNGDGLTDLFMNYTRSDGRAAGPQYNQAAQVWLAQPNGTFNKLILPVADGMPDYYRIFGSGDFNGDGLTDLYLHFSHSNGRAAGTPNYSRQSEIWLSKGDGTFDREILPVADSMPNEYQVHSSGDFNGDGLTDLFMNYTRSDGRAAGPQYNQAAQVWLAQPNGTFNKLILPVADGMPDYYRIFGSGDFNGDGLTDLYLNFSQSDGRAYESETTEPPYLWTSVGPMPGPLARVTSGLGVETLITYRPSTDASVYTRDSGANAADYPIVDTQPPMQVVSRVERPDGIGGTKVSTYHYKGAKVDLTGRGFLGFREMTETDEQTGITQTSEFYQYYPFTLTKKSQTRELNGITLSQTLNEYNSQDLGGTRKMIWLKQTLSSGSDLNGVALPSKATYYQYDAYCNPTQITVSSSDGYSKVTTNTYLNDESNWLLGRLLTATVSSEAPAAGAQAPLEDIAPDPLLDITDVTNAALNTVYERGAVVAGTNRVVTATVSGGDAQIRKNGAGDWTSSIQIDPGETLNIRMTSGSAYDSVETATVTIGSANFDWTVTAAPLSRTLVIAENVNDLNLRTHHDSLYPPPVDGEPTPISVSAIVEPGVIVGSNSSTTPALDVGNWPNDVTLTINVQGRIQGHGGEGGNAATSTGYQTGYVDGKDGGTAFYTRHALTLDVGSGQIWGGGGGGGGGRIKDGGKHAGSGGGGAGQLPGQPGVKGHGGDNTVGQPGTTEAGGAGGPSGTGEAGGGGRGGDPGLDGANTNISGRTSLGGKAGKAIDAASVVISQIGTGDVRGPVLGGGGPCSGVEVGGYCWHVGAAGQSCDAVCSGYGSCDLAGTRDYAGSGGTLANCQSVATALGLSGSAANSESGNQGYGCTAISFLGTPLIIRVPSPATTCTASDGSMQRICACSN